MYELIQVGESSYYIESPAKIGLVRVEENSVCLIDSGNDKDAGRKVRQILERNGWQLNAIYNTHSHADHIGGNHYLQGQTGCRIYAPGVEAAFTCYPLLEPAFLYGGYPSKALRHKFLMAHESNAQLLSEEALPEGLSVIPLAGHAMDMVGFRTADDVVYLADCLSSDEILDKYQITFIHNVGAYLDTLERVKQMSASLFVPAHAEPTVHIAPLAQRNMDKVHEIAGRINRHCREPLPFEQVLQRLFRDYGLRMNVDQYVLVGSTVRSYLAWMGETGQLEYLFEDSAMLWRTIPG